jgi:hypothetical protein
MPVPFRKKKKLDMGFIAGGILDGQGPKIKFEISDSHRGGYEENYLLVCDAV